MHLIKANLSWLQLSAVPNLCQIASLCVPKDLTGQPHRVVFRPNLRLLRKVDIRGVIFPNTSQQLLKL